MHSSVLYDTISATQLEMNLKNNPFLGHEKSVKLKKGKKFWEWNKITQPLLHPREYNVQ